MTPRDREIVRWIGRHRFVTAGQVASRFGVGRSQCYARLTGLVRLRLLTHKRLFYGQPGVYVATRGGLEVAGVALRPATIDLRTYEHDLELVSLIQELEKGATTCRVLTERELRAIDTPAGRAPNDYRPRFAAQLGQCAQLALTPAGAPRLHFPDAVLLKESGDRTAIELERTLKGRSRLRRILRAYVSSRHLASVRYFVPEGRLQAVVLEEVRGLRAEDVIEVRPWTALSLRRSNGC